MSLDGRVDYVIKFDQVDAALTQTAELADLIDALSIAESNSLSFGSGVGQVNAFWHDTRTLGVGGSELLDIHDTLIDPATGKTITFSEIKVFVVRCQSPLELKMSFDVANGWIGVFNATVNLNRGDVFIWHNFSGLGAPIGAGNSDIGFLDTGGAGGDYDIIIVGIGTRS